MSADHPMRNTGDSVPPGRSVSWARTAADLREAGRSDELGDTIHYGLVAEQVCQEVESWSHDKLGELCQSRPGGTRERGSL